MINEVAFEKLKHYCAYQERCHKEVRSKLLSLKVYGDELEEIITGLIDENYLNEERFARSYARGKFRMKQWGRLRIRQELKKRHISEYLIKKAMTEIEEGEYDNTIRELVQKYKSKYGDLADFAMRKKLISLLMNKGYEQSLIYTHIEKVGG